MKYARREANMLAPKERGGSGAERPRSSGDVLPDAVNRLRASERRSMSFSAHHGARRERNGASGPEPSR